jgi:hypothetical protein
MTSPCTAPNLAHWVHNDSRWYMRGKIARTLALRIANRPAKFYEKTHEKKDKKDGKKVSKRRRSSLVFHWCAGKKELMCVWMCAVVDNV